MEPIIGSGKPPLEIAKNKERYDGLKKNSEKAYYCNIAKTALAILGGLTVTGLCATLSIKLITGKSITTQFVGLGSLIITVPIGVSVPIVIGVKVAKRKDWTRYHDEKVAHQKCIEMLTCSLENLSKINLVHCGKSGILSSGDADAIKKRFVEPYMQNKKELDKYKKKDPNYYACLEHAGVRKDLEYPKSYVEVNTLWEKIKVLEKAWKNFQSTDGKIDPPIGFGNNLYLLLPFGYKLASVDSAKQVSESVEK